MTLLHISDTHGQHQALHLPDADIIIHSGDFTFGGSEEEASDFLHWFCGLPYKHKVFIAGNHDMCLYGTSNRKGLPQNVHYLCNSGVTLEGIRFYGVPMFMEDEFEGNMDALYHRIPDGTHVLITHQPPFGFCDAANYGNGLSHRGSRELAERVQTLHNLRVHCFGHEHDAYGTAQLDNVLYSNAALLTHDYRLVHAPVLIEYPVII